VINRQLGDRVRVSANAGIRFRPTTTFTDTMMTMGTITTSTELPVGIAAAYAFVPHKFELVGEVYGAIPIGPHQGYQQLEALGGVKLYLAKNSYLSLGAGRGLVTNMAGNPDFRAFIGIVFEPSAGDRRNQHVVDDNVVAEKPPEPPPTDKDDDEIIDPNKLCNVQVQIDCPDHPMVVVDDGVMVTLEPIEFEFDSAVIKPSSYHVVDAVVTALNDNPNIDVSVDGHTDERGSAEYNLDLSKRRAASVMQYLIDHGIARARLESHGYGKTQPKDARHIEEAWTKNRRVEFPIKKHR
jgi:outer membrane protein OmpA-like peptidoglycan-associated protein